MCGQQGVIAWSTSDEKAGKLSGQPILISHGKEYHCLGCASEHCRECFLKSGRSYGDLRDLLVLSPLKARASFRSGGLPS